jgi:hypothetical protein
MLSFKLGAGMTQTAAARPYVLGPADGQACLVGGGAERADRRSPMGTEHGNAAIVRRFWDLVWNKGELPAIDELIDDDLHQPRPGSRRPGLRLWALLHASSLLGGPGSADHAIVLPRRRLPPPRRPPQESRELRA